MATGYTANLTTESSFADFAKTCARAFGATIMQRDDALSPELELPEPSDYHVKALASAERQLANLLRLSPSEASEAAKEAYRSACADYTRRIDERRTTRAAYEQMIIQAIHWSPPTSEHAGLKKFMLEQLRSSVEFDCDGSYDQPPVQQDGIDWYNDQIERAKKDIAYHTKEQKEEEKRTAGRRAWIQALINSLPTTAAPSVSGASDVL